MVHPRGCWHGLKIIERKIIATNTLKGIGRSELGKDM
jgi:hypothetical protein